MRAEIQSATAFIDQCIESVCTNQLTADAASAAKLIATDLCNSVANRCLQLWGGYGYLKNSPIGKQFVDQRVTRIYGGANEVLLEVVAKGMGFQREKRSKL
jgi:acyl-CoA dehydrogenase